jgi:hypothetical protein
MAEKAAGGVVASRAMQLLIGRSVRVLALAPVIIACASQAPAPAPAALPPPPPAAPAPAPDARPAAPPEEPADAIEQVLRPAELDPQADKYLAPEYAYFDPAAKPAAGTRVLVYLVGARNTPERGRAMGAWLARQGFAVVVPGYANDYDIRKLCEAPTTPDRDCHAKLRLEALEGVDHSPHIDISKPNSLQTRIVRMLDRLASEQPQAGWGRGLARGMPRWEELLVAGHSHGSSTAALIGKVRRVNRVVMLSGPFDNRGGAPADWLRRRTLTPPDRYFGLTHAAEEQHPGHLKNWKALAIDKLGPVAIVDGAAPPYGGSHQLVTKLVVTDGENNPHGMTAAGKASPRLPDGTYVLAPVWRYLFGL